MFLVSVVLQTWGHDSNLNLLFFTDSSNSSYPRVDLGIPNTITGFMSNHLKRQAQDVRPRIWRLNIVLCFVRRSLRKDSWNLEICSKAITKYVLAHDCRR